MCLINVAGADIDVPDDVVIQDVAVLEEEDEYKFKWDCCNENVESNKSDKTTVTDSVHEAEQHRESSSHSPPFEWDSHDVIVASNETGKTSVTESVRY